MAVSQNNFSANDRSVIHTATAPGTGVKLPVRRGPAGDLLLYAAGRWHREVEPLRAGECWGYAERPIRGSTTLSNHASGTAIDLNATKHPLGAVGTFTTPQVQAIRRILADCGGAIRWGGDYLRRKDEMHLEIVATEKRCAQILLRHTKPPRPTIRRGDTGEAVELIQRFLGVVRPGEPGYGQYGPATESAVIRYQRMRGLEPDGICGPATWRETGL